MGYLTVGVLLLCLASWVSSAGVVVVSTQDKAVWQNVNRVSLQKEAILFTVKAPRQAFLQLSPYEIWLRSNPKKSTLIKGGTNGTVYKKTGGLFDNKSQKPFWVSWSGGVLKLGKGQAVGKQVILSTGIRQKPAQILIRSAPGSKWVFNVPKKGAVTLKDDKLILIKQKKRFFCDFEHGLCNMMLNAGGNGTWVDSKAPKQKNGPEIDHTTGKAAGHYLYRPGKTNWNKHFIACTPYLRASSNTCLSFAYHMAGSGTSSLIVSAKTDQSTRELVAKRGDQGSGWSEVSVSIQKIAARFRVCWDAHGKSAMSDIAIDDVAVGYGVCEVTSRATQPTTPKLTTIPPTPNQPTTTSLTPSQTAPTLSTMPTQPTTTEQTSPQTEPTPSTTSQPPAPESTTHGTLTKLTSLGISSTVTTIPGPTPTAAAGTFTPHAGPTTTVSNINQSIAVLSKESSSPLSVGLSANSAVTSGGKNSFQQTQTNSLMDRLGIACDFTKNETCNYVVVGPWTGKDPEGLTCNANDKEGTITFASFTAHPDQVFLMDWSLTNQKDSIDTVTLRQSTTSNGRLSKGVIVLGGSRNCGFETSLDLCGYKQAQDNTFDWTRNKGPTPSGGTGPFSDSLKNKTGYYMYIESSAPRRPTDMARLLSEVYPPSDDRCLRFFYNMRGTTIGTLNVKLYLPSTKKYTTPIFSKSSDNLGREWHMGEVTVSSDQRFSVAFEGIVGGRYSDIAIDGISFWDTPCNSSDVTFSRTSLQKLKLDTGYVSVSVQRGGQASGHSKVSISRIFIGQPRDVLEAYLNQNFSADRFGSYEDHGWTLCSGGACESSQSTVQAFLNSSVVPEGLVKEEVCGHVKYRVESNGEAHSSSSLHLRVIAEDSETIINDTAATDYEIGSQWNHMQIMLPENEAFKLSILFSYQISSEHKISQVTVQSVSVQTCLKEVLTTPFVTTKTTTPLTTKPITEASTTITLISETATKPITEAFTSIALTSEPVARISPTITSVTEPVSEAVAFRNTTVSETQLPSTLTTQKVLSSLSTLGSYTSTEALSVSPHGDDSTTVLPTESPTSTENALFSTEDSNLANTTLDNFAPKNITRTGDLSETTVSGGELSSVSRMFASPSSDSDRDQISDVTTLSGNVSGSGGDIVTAASDVTFSSTADLTLSTVSSSYPAELSTSRESDFTDSVTTRLDFPTTSDSGSTHSTDSEEKTTQTDSETTDNELTSTAISFTTQSESNVTVTSLPPTDPSETNPTTSRSLETSKPPDASASSTIPWSPETSKTTDASASSTIPWSPETSKTTDALTSSAIPWSPETSKTIETSGHSHTLPVSTIPPPSTRKTTMQSIVGVKTTSKMTTSPTPAHPENVLPALKLLSCDFKEYDHCSGWTVGHAWGPCAQGLCLQHEEASSAQATTIQSLVTGGVPKDSCFQVILGVSFSTLPTSPAASVWLNAVRVIFKNYVQGPQSMPVNNEIVCQVPVSHLKPIYLTIRAAGTGDYDLLAVKSVEVKQCSDIHPTNPVSGAKTEAARNKGDPVSNNTWMYGTIGGACGLVVICVIVISVVMYRKRYMETMRMSVDRGLLPEDTMPLGVETKSAAFGNPMFDANVT